MNRSSLIYDNPLNTRQSTFPDCIAQRFLSCRALSGLHLVPFTTPNLFVLFMTS
jgi:hypothetical protein